MSNNAISGGNDIGNASGWTVAGTGDFNGNGISDVLFQNSGGAVVDWLMQNGTVSGASLIGSAAGWKAS